MAEIIDPSRRHTRSAGVAAAPARHRIRGWSAARGRSSGRPHLPALDGIRAVAVSAVLVFHGGLSWASGGFLGVDAFFVLSGYLITSLLLAEWTRSGGRIDLAAFWGRRARRLLPALLIMITAVAIGARVLLPAEEVRLLRGDGLAALLYAANWRMIFRDGDYFAQTAAPSPLEHTWSLAIEEQFYLLWPLVLIAVLHHRRRRTTSADGPIEVRTRLWWLVVVCGVGAAASTVALAVTYSAEDPGRAYYGTDTRGAAILIGAGLAALLALGRERHGEASRWRRALLGALVAIAGAGAVWAMTHLSGTDGVLYRGGMACFALAVAILIAHVTMVPAGWSARLLSLPPLPVLGRISYGVYLWHWPVFIAANADRTGLHGLPLFTARCLLTLAIATASYVLVERPVQLRLWPRRRLLVATTAGAAVATVGAALVMTTAVRLPPPPPEASLVAAVDRFLEGGGNFGGRASGDIKVGSFPRTARARASRPGPAPLHRRRPGKPVVVDVFGDSVAWTLVHYLPGHPDLDVRDRTLMGCGVSRTAPFRYFDRHYRGLMPQCRDWPGIWKAAIARDDPDVAFILVGRWETMDRVLDGRWTHVGEPEFDAHLRSELELAISVAGARGAHLLLATQPYNRRGERLDGSLFPEDEPQRVTAWNRLLRGVATRHPNVTVVELGQRVSPEGRFTWTAGGYQVRSDGLHLTPSGVQGWIAPWLQPQLIDIVPR